MIMMRITILILMTIIKNNFKHNDYNSNDEDLLLQELLKFDRQQPVKKLAERSQEPAIATKVA